MEEEQYYEEYSLRCGKPGSALFIFENRMLLFFIIFLISSLFRITEYSGSANWPLKYVLSIFDGKSSNLIFYALSFFIALKLMKHPALTVTLFLGISGVYTAANILFYDYHSNGIAVSVYKISKMSVLFIIINFSYCRKVTHYLYLMILSFLISAAVWALCFGVYYSYYMNSGYGNDYYNYVSGKLIKFGYEKPINDYIEIVHTNQDMEYFMYLDGYRKFYDIDMSFSYEVWEKILLKSAGGRNLDRVSEIMLEKNIIPEYEVMTGAIEKAGIPGKDFRKLKNFIILSSKTVNSENAADFLSFYMNSDPEIVRFGITVSGKSGEIFFIPQLLTYLISVDDNISKAAYLALVEITGVNVAQNLNLPENSPKVYSFFKNFYLSNYTR